jgi:hypothetical protein
MICYIGHTSGGDEILDGTGFFIAVPAPKGSTNPAFPDRSLYVVTAKHVADAVKGDFWVRVNQKDGTARMISGEGLEWRYHPQHRPNNRIDIAVCLVPYSKRSDILALALLRQKVVMLLRGKSSLQRLPLERADAPAWSLAGA